MKNKFTLISDSVTYDFIYIGTIKPKCDEKNNCILTNINNTDYCNFSVSFPEKEGIYLWVLDNQIEYIGNSININHQFNFRFGTITSRNCEKDGQSTNRNLNNAVYKEYQNGKLFAIYFCEIINSKKEKSLILKKYKTKYNKRRG